jgi:hypothetical protein
MKKHLFCFTLDTEPDNLWEDAPSLSFDHFGKLQDFHSRLVEAGARPTYLTTSEVAENESARCAMLRILDSGSAEIGAHFHTWTREWPFPVPDFGRPPIHASVHHLGQAVEERMLEYTCGALESAFGARPTSYRGGRWSLSGQSVRSLRNCGIRVDSTFTPGISWVDTTHPWLSSPDFRSARQGPFYLAGESLEASDRGDILELPVGACFVPDRVTAVSDRLAARLRRKLSRIARRPYGVIWLRPTAHSRSSLRQCLKSLHDASVGVWVSMIHSSEIVPCKYFKGEDEVRDFQKRCVALVADALELGAQSVTLSEALNLYEKEPAIHRIEPTFDIQCHGARILA